MRPIYFIICLLLFNVLAFTQDTKRDTSVDNSEQMITMSRRPINAVDILGSVFLSPIYIIVNNRKRYYDSNGEALQPNEVKQRMFAINKDAFDKFRLAQAFRTGSIVGVALTATLSFAASISLMESLFNVSDRPGLLRRAATFLYSGLATAVIGAIVFPILEAIFIDKSLEIFNTSLQHKNASYKRDIKLGIKLYPNGLGLVLNF